MMRERADRGPHAGMTLASGPGAWLDVDLPGLASNWAALRAAMPATIAIDPVLKADAFGHGAIAIGRVLQALGAERFCVATFEEAVRLREGGVTKPVLILYSLPPDLAPAAATQGFRITASDYALTAAALSKLERAADVPELAVELEVETGLGRAGIAMDCVEAVASAIARSRFARLDGVWTHLTAAEDRAATRRQIDLFSRAVNIVQAATGQSDITRHVLASGGVLAYAATGTHPPPFDRVRVGLLLYGVIPEGMARAAASLQLARAVRPLMTLRARPIRVTDLPAGSGVSYGPTFVTSRPSRIATLPVGFADGYARALSNRGTALVRGHRVPVVGTVAMDAVIIDVTDVPGRPVEVADEFVLLGRQGDDCITVAELAGGLSTIGDEILVSIAGRVPRVYRLPDGGLVHRSLTTCARQERRDWDGALSRRALAVLAGGHQDRRSRHASD